MKSGISKILSGYKNSLEHARSIYEEEYKFRMDNALEFYETFLKNLIIDFSILKNNPVARDRIFGNIKRWFSSEFKFAAIDGTCFKENLDPYLVFFSAAYAVRGNLRLDKPAKPIMYERWSVEQDKSVVSYLPIPYANLSNIMEEEIDTFDDEQRINYSNIHLELMNLSEVYLSYAIASNDSRPDLILLDQSISSTFNSQGIGRRQKNKKINILNKEIHGFKIDEHDVSVCYSHPYNDILNIPSGKNFQFHNFLLRKLYEAKYSISFEKLEILLTNIKMDVSIKHLETRIDKYLNNVENKPKMPKLIIFDHKKNEIKLNPKYIKSWDRLKNFYNQICKSILETKDSTEDTGMIYTYVEEGDLIKDWLKPGDILFLKAIGYRLLIEECWKNNILLVGIAKDSSTAYFSNFYLNVLRNEGLGREYEVYDFQPKNLPWTDRLLLEGISLFNNDVAAPWSTVEFDSAFITLRKKKNEAIITGSGMNNNIYYPEKLFLRSLSQFYLNKNKTIPSAGHVIFIDRLVSPKLDKNTKELYLGDNNQMKILFFKDKSSTNPTQEILVLLLDLLTKNLFPNVIGYPDPLHKADWGAKSLGDKIRPIIKSSQGILKRNPLIHTLRQLRKKSGGR